MTATPIAGDARQETKVIAGLQYLRGFAAALVVLYHAANVFGPSAYYPDRSWEKAFLFGHSGVELFFVLSGFIICYIHWDRIERPGELVSYIRKRLVRIYPPVLLVVLAWAMLRWASGEPMSAIEWFNSVTLIPIAFVYAPPTLWTLSFEMAFYALFLTAFFSRRLFVALLLAWGLSGYVICEFTAIGHANALNPLLGSAYTFLFGLGAAAFFVLRRAPAWLARARPAMAITAGVLFAIAAYLDVTLQLSGLKGLSLEIASREITPLFGAAGFLAILVLGDPRVHLRGWPHQALLFLGNASYAIYLWHLLPQRLIAHFLGRLGLAGAGTRWIAVCLIVVSGLAAGSVVYYFVERPLLRWLNRFFRKQPKDPGASVSAAIDPVAGLGH